MHIQHTAGDAFARQVSPPAAAGEAETPGAPHEPLQTERSCPVPSDAGGGSGGGDGGGSGSGGGGGGASCGDGGGEPVGDDIFGFAEDWLSSDAWLVCSQ